MNSKQLSSIVFVVAAVAQLAFFVEPCVAQIGIACTLVCNGDFENSPPNCWDACKPDSMEAKVEVKCPFGGGRYLAITPPCDECRHTQVYGAGETTRIKVSQDNSWITLKFDAKNSCRQDCEIVERVEAIVEYENGDWWVIPATRTWTTHKVSAFVADAGTYVVPGPNFWVSGCDCELDIDNVEFCVTSQDVTTLNDDRCLPHCVEQCEELTIDECSSIVP